MPDLALLFKIIPNIFYLKMEEEDATHSTHKTT